MSPLFFGVFTCWYAKLWFFLDTFWTEISTSSHSEFERSWADPRAARPTEKKSVAPSWNYSESTNQITDLHVSKIISANEIAQNISKTVRGKHLNWESQLYVAHYLLSLFLFVEKWKVDFQRPTNGEKFDLFKI